MKYLGFLLLVLSGNVMAEEVYYCSDNYANGFREKDGQFKPFNFIEGGKFKMKLQDDGNITIENPKIKSGIDLYYCLTSYKGIIPELKNHKSCVDDKSNGWFFNFNRDDGRYILIQGMGYVFASDDDVITRIGSCTKL